MEADFVPGQSDNLPKVDMGMVLDFLTNNPLYTSAEVRGVKLSKRPKFTTTVRTVSLSFKKYGESLEPQHPTILIIHGFLGNKKLWEGIAKTISNLTKDAVMTIDVRNHGDSQHVSSHKYTECARDIQELMAKQNIDKAILLGYSMGGRIAMSLALMEPKLVSGIIVVEISPVSSCRDILVGYPEIMKAMKDVDFTELKQQSLDRLSEVQTAQIYAQKQLRNKITDDKIMKKILTNIAIRKGVIGWSCNLDVLFKNFKYIAAFPKSLLNNVYYGPTIFIGGQKSDFIPPDDLPRIRVLFPKSTINYIPETGHYIQCDDPKRFMELVIDFIKRNRN